ncbi:MAG: hypothetical protein BGN88_06355 [Clostridiales bacterium 43-6]|nr:MAG: hypothetical protein BGN88_06355 [Clostridiales bacterium 43-6]
MKYFKLMGVIILMIFIVSCTNKGSVKNNNSNNDETSSIFAGSKLSESTSQKDADSTPKDIYDRLDNKTHKNQLIKTEYSLESLQTKFARNGNPFSGYALTVKEIDDNFPIECIRKISKKFYYVVYKVKEGGYLYVHLINPNEDEWTGQNNGLEQSNSYYANGKSNIKEIKIGDSFTKVSTHDTSIAENNFNFIYEYINGEERFYSVHIDSKKLFVINYNNSKSIDEIRQSSVKSIDEYVKYIISPKGFNEYNYEYNYTILEIDL